MTDTVKRDIAQEVTDLVISQLEQGVIPWRKPWVAAGLAPTSMQTGKEYRGVNALILSIMMLTHPEYERNLWLTFKQAQALGGSVRKGEHGQHVVWWSIKPDEKDSEGKVTKRGFMHARAFTVFNLSQCEGVEIPPKFREASFTWTPSEALESIWAGYQGRPTLEHKEQGKAFYVPKTDSITLPPKSAFPSVADYAETFLHEAVHSTGHESRLKRFAADDTLSPFGSEPYAEEELVAELGAMMLLSKAGIEADTANSAAYIGGWLKRLKDDKSLIMKAAQKADKAVQHITGTVAEDKEEAA